MRETADLMLLRIPKSFSFTKKQKEDSSLTDCFKKAILTPEHPEKYSVEKHLLYREVLMTPHREGEGPQKEFIVPVKYQENILEKAHKDVFGAHRGISRTKQRVAHNFYWPGMGKQVKQYYQSCDTCQKRGTGNDEG